MAPSKQLVELIRFLAAEGLSASAIASQCGVSCYSINRWASKFGIAIQLYPQVQTPESKVRAAKMAAMYRQGITLRSIGEKFGITGERVRQLLKRQGLLGVDGGMHKAVEARKDAAAAKRDARYMVKHGMTYAEYKALQKIGAAAAYRQQKASAASRAITWELTLPQWWALWSASGKWEQRGCGKGRYVMARIKREDGYRVGNVHIQLGTENSFEAVDTWRGHTKTARGVFFLYAGRKRPYLAKVGRRSLGLFDTEEAAVAARMAFAQANGYRMGGDGRLVKA